MFRFRLVAAVVTASVLVPGMAVAASSTMHVVDEHGVGEAVGTIGFTDSQYGLLIAPDLEGLAPGLHGLHVHINPDCAPEVGENGTVAAGTAGGHFDPAGMGVHEGPYGEGHLGDLPNLMVMPDGTASLPLLAPRLKESDLAGRAIMIHAEYDDYSDSQPGGTRAWCGVVEE